MAENDRCAKRRPVGDLHTVFADHHEWRFLRRYGVLERAAYTEEGNIYYCVFCLEAKKVKDDEPPT